MSINPYHCDAIRDWIAQPIDVFHSPEMKQFILDEVGGSIIPTR